MNETKNKQMKAIVTKIEVIEFTKHSKKATIFTLDKAPSVEEEKELFGSDESVILEF